MILIAESDSTKTEWCIAYKDEIIERCITDGIHPLFQSRKEISRILRLQLPPIFFKTKIDSISFYGAGCSSDEKKNIVKASFESNFKSPTTIENDLLGAARALFLDKPGIACILGTGSNSCYYNGSEIEKNIKPLGYILGDEGSGAALGKAFLSDCLKGLAPDFLVTSFYEKYKIDIDGIIDYVYTKPFPNRLLALFSYFLAEHLDQPYIFDLVYNNLKKFFERNILQYENCQTLPIRFIGNIANTYAPIIRQIGNDLKLNIDLIIESPIDRLIKYHQLFLQKYVSNN